MNFDIFDQELQKRKSGFKEFLEKSPLFSSIYVDEKGYKDLVKVKSKKVCKFLCHG